MTSDKAQLVVSQADVVWLSGGDTPTQEILVAFKNALPDAKAWEKHIRLLFDEYADD